MRREVRLLSFFILLLLVLLCPTVSHAQAWSGILNPVSGAGACIQGNTSSPDRCAIDWTTAGIGGGIPNRTTIYTTINASAYGNGTTDATSGIQTALNACPSGEVVLLSSGTFLINSQLTVPSNCTLRGSGANQTILNAKGTGAVVNLGTSSPNLENWPPISITAGATVGPLVSPCPARQAFRQARSFLSMS